VTLLNESVGVGSAEMVVEPVMSGIPDGLLGWWSPGPGVSATMQHAAKRTMSRVNCMIGKFVLVFL
jgi:hypothetical protein